MSLDSTGLDTIERCPIQHSYDPFAPDSLAEPQRAITRYSSESPVFYSPAVGWWVVSRYEDLVAIMRDTERFSSTVSLGQPVMTEAATQLAPGGDPTDLPTLVNADPPAHKRIRALANKAFTPKAVLAWAPMITARVEELLDDVADRGQFDLLADFAIPLPITVIARILGFPEHVWGSLHEWSNSSIAVRAQNLDEQSMEKAWRAVGEFSAFLDGFIAECRAKPGQDLTSALVTARDGDQAALSDKEISSVIGQLIVAGNETTRYFIAYLILQIMSDDVLRDQLLHDNSLMPAVIEEGLRHAGVAKGLLRITTEDVEVGGVLIPKGDFVAVSWGAGNRDPAVFVSPDTFDIDRPNVRRHIAFGFGEHFCIGAPLARLEASIALTVLLQRMPDIRRANNDALVWSPNLMMRGLERLDVTWGVSEERPSGPIPRIDPDLI